MSDTAVARLIGGLMSLAGIALGAVSLANDWTLFLPFAAVLLGFGIWCQTLPWTWRQRG